MQECRERIRLKNIGVVLAKIEIPRIRFRTRRLQFVRRIEQAESPDPATIIGRSQAHFFGELLKIGFIADVNTAHNGTVSVFL